MKVHQSHDFSFFKKIKKEDCINMVLNKKLKSFQLKKLTNSTLQRASILLSSNSFYANNKNKNNNNKNCFSKQHASNFINLKLK